MKKIFLFLIVVAIVYGIYYVVMHSGRMAQENIHMTQGRGHEFKRQLEQVSQISRMKNWQAELVSFQRMDHKIDRDQLQKRFQEIAVKHHVKIVEWAKRQNVYALSLLADLDTDVYEFWQACVRQMPGQLQPVSVGLFRPNKAQEKVQGRIDFVSVLEPRESL